MPSQYPPLHCSMQINAMQCNTHCRVKSLSLVSNLLIRAEVWPWRGPGTNWPWWHTLPALSATGWWHLHTSDGALGLVVYWWHMYHCSRCIWTLGMDQRTLFIVQLSLLFTQNSLVHSCFLGGVCCAFICSSLSDQKLRVASFQLGKYQLCWTQCVLSDDITNIKYSGQLVRYMQILTFDWRVEPKICNPIEWSLDLLLLHISIKFLWIAFAFLSFLW